MLTNKKRVQQTFLSAHFSTRTRLGVTCLLLLTTAGSSLYFADAQNTSSKASQVQQWMRQKTLNVRGLKGKNLGLEPASAASITRAAKFRVVAAKRGERPSELLLTEFLPPVASQGNQGSCVAWSTTYYAYTYQVGQNRKRTPEELAQPKYQFSPAFTYNMGPHRDDSEGGGMQFSDALKTLRSYGATTLENVPYDPNDGFTKPDNETTAKAAKYRARDYGLLFEGPLRTNRPINVEVLKTYLAETHLPCVIGIPVFQDFAELADEDDDYVYSPSSVSKGNYFGLHAITIVGYDDSKKALRMVNSWGKGWGNNGFIWLADEFVSQLSLEGWGLVAGGAISRAPNAVSGPIKAQTKLSTHVSIVPGSPVTQTR